MFHHTTEPAKTPIGQASAKDDAPAQTVEYEFPYQRTFDAIAAATSIYAEGVGINVSVQKFQEAFNGHRDAKPLSPVSSRKLAQTVPTREQIAILLWHRFAPESHEEWEHETHRAEYLDAADAVLFRLRGPFIMLSCREAKRCLHMEAGCICEGDPSVTNASASEVHDDR